MVRHGETVANKDDVSAGAFDTPLTEKGRQQAAALEEILHKSGLNFDYIVYSGLSRSTDTAMILNRHFNKPFLENKNIAEQDFGSWQGMKRDEMMNLINAGHIPPSGESLTYFYERAVTGIDESISAMQGIPLIVTHGGVFDAFFNRHGLDKSDIQNCILYKFFLEENDGTSIWRTKKY